MRNLFIILIIPIVLFSSIHVQAEEQSNRKWQDESIYYIQVDRFMNGNRANDGNADYDDPQAYHGGDLEGVIMQLEYIKEQGYTAIQLSPIMAGSVFHGYSVNDFESVEEHFGNMDDLVRLVEEAHDLGFKVIMDFPVSYVGPEHPWVEERESWLSTSESDHPWLSGLYQLNTENTELQQYISSVAQVWVEQTGVDGLYLETFGDASPALYEVVSENLKAEYPNLFLYGSSELSPEAIGPERMNGFVPSNFTQELRETFKAAGNDLDRLMNVWQENRSTYKDPYYFIHTADPITGSRFTHETVLEQQNPITRWELALTYTFTMPGIPLVKFGTEIPLDDGGELNRIEMMNFKISDEQLSHRIEKLNSIRDQFPALTRGDFELLHNEGGLVVYKRSYHDQSMIVAINNATETKVAELEGVPEGYQLRGLLKDGIVRQQGEEGFRLGMERETADVFVVEPNEGYNWLFIGFVVGVLGLFVGFVTIMGRKNRKA